MNTLVMFISPTCPVCKSLVPTAKSLASAEKNRLNLVFASDGDKLEQHQAYAKDLDLDRYPYVLSEKLGMNFEVSKLPFAALIGADGTLQSKGLVNTREHMESLIEAMDTGIATLQEYVGQAQQDHEHSVKEKAS
jgi:methylamine dehydrogenase accessory protein MauD